MSLFKINLFLRLFSFFKLPLLFFAGPRVVELSDQKSIVQVKLGYRTRNHLGVMYFGALAMGAELSIAIKAVESIQSSKKRIDFIFKDFKAEFLKRADGDVHFVCDQVPQVQNLIFQASQTSQRLEGTFTGKAFVPSKSNDPVMTYQLTLSVKNRSQM